MENLGHANIWLTFCIEGMLSSSFFFSLLSGPKFSLLFKLLIELRSITIFPSSLQDGDFKAPQPKDFDLSG